MTPEELTMLRSYEDGPRIWDAASLTDKVFSLLYQGLIEQVIDSRAYQITDKGRQALEAASRPYDYERDDPRIAQAEEEREFGGPDDYSWFEDSPDNPNVPER